MLAILSAILVMTESGSAPAPRLDLSLDERIAAVHLAPVAPAPPPEEGPLRLARTLADCNPGVVGVEAGWDRLAASQDLVICRATMMKDEPVGRGFLWLGSLTGLQADVSPSRVQLKVRLAP